jgi:hypothetical protein
MPVFVLSDLVFFTEHVMEVVAQITQVGLPLLCVCIDLPHCKNTSRQLIFKRVGTWRDMCARFHGSVLGFAWLKIKKNGECAPPEVKRAWRLLRGGCALEKVILRFIVWFSSLVHDEVWEKITATRSHHTHSSTLTHTHTHTHSLAHTHTHSHLSRIHTDSHCHEPTCSAPHQASQRIFGWLLVVKTNLKSWRLRAYYSMLHVHVLTGKSVSVKISLRYGRCALVSKIMAN